MSTPQTNDARTVRVSTTQRASLRDQTLEILELEHHRFDAFADQSPAEQLAAATIFRDAFAVLDTLGWEPSPGAPAVEILLTADHITQLEARRVDLALAIGDHLDDRPIPVHTLDDLTAIISAYHQAAEA